VSGPPAKRSIVIIGGGVVGCAIAYHLAKRGAGREVIVLEKHRVASGTTAASVGGIRCQFSTEVNIRLSLESVAFWRRFEEEMGGASAGYHEMGYLFLAQTEGEREIFRRNVSLQNDLGVRSQLLEPDEAERLVPGMNVNDLTAAAYHATDGRASPHEATHAYAARARDGGVRFVEGCAVTAIDTAGGRVRSVSTADATFHVDRCVIAAGPWSAAVGALAGVDLPVTPFRREIFVTEPLDGLPARFPFVIDLHAGWYFIREGDGILMAGRKDARPSYDCYVDRSSLAVVGEFAVHRHPAFARARFGRRSWSGLYEVSPDDHAILGAVPGVGGLYVACGFSGHGFQHSPATGRLLAELLTDGRATGIDITSLGLDRFRTGALLREPLTAHAGTLAG
jgi:sarcosine oxidase subunit beta